MDPRIGTPRTGEWTNEIRFCPRTSGAVAVLSATIARRQSSGVESKGASIADNAAGHFFFSLLFFNRNTSRHPIDLARFDETNVRINNEWKKLWHTVSPHWVEKAWWNGRFHFRWGGVLLRKVAKSMEEGGRERFPVERELKYTGCFLSNVQL